MSKAAASGAVALIFLVLGFQAAIFTGNVFRYNREHRVDTVYVVEAGSDSGQDLLPGDKDLGRIAASQTCPSSDEPGGYNNRHQAIAEDGRRSVVTKGLAPRQEPGYSDSRRAIAEKLEKKSEPELFQFDPNTVTHEDLVRLGFSDRQAQVIENYRNKGGKYYSPADFAKMYVVDSAAFSRLKPYIKISRLDLNTADSLQLISLRGIGPYYAHKILEYRRRLGGVFTSKDQLLEIEGFDADRLGGFSQGVTVGGATPRYTIWTATREELSAHPYIGAYAAKGIIRYKSVTDTAARSLDDLVLNGVISEEKGASLRYLAGHGQGHHE